MRCSALRNNGETDFCPSLLLPPVSAYHGGGACVAVCPAVRLGDTARRSIKVRDEGRESGNSVTCVFCPVCGSPIFKQSEGYPQFKSFHAATVDDPSLFEPQQSVWTSQRQFLDLIDESLPAN